MICIKQVKKEVILDLALSCGQDYFIAADEKIGTIHVAYFDDDGSVVGCLSMSVTAKTCFESIPQYKIDGIAVKENKQNGGIGFALLKMAEFIALNNQVGCVWLDSNAAFAGYFKKHGYSMQTVAHALVKYPEDHCCSSCVDCSQNNVCSIKHE